MALLSVEGDEQVGRVTNLHSATLGYSSVIYGDIQGENEMINAWNEVWEHLNKDKFLPGKLVSITVFVHGLNMLFLSNCTFNLLEMLVSLYVEYELTIYSKQTNI